MESYLDDGAYLWGTLLSGPGVARLGASPGYRPFVTWRPLPDADEGRVFGAFWTHLAALRERTHAAGLSFAAYCYSRQAEERWMRSAPERFAGSPGVPSTAEVAAFCAGPEWIDLYAHLREQYVITGSMRLKALAPLAGFGWRDPDPGGENSMAWYRGAIGADGPAQPGLATRVLEYNEDDVPGHPGPAPSPHRAGGRPAHGGRPGPGLARRPAGQRGGIRSAPSSRMTSPLR